MMNYMMLDCLAKAKMESEAKEMVSTCWRCDMLLQLPVHSMGWDTGFLGQRSVSASSSIGCTSLQMFPLPSISLRITVVVYMTVCFAFVFLLSKVACSFWYFAMKHYGSGPEAMLLQTQSQCAVVRLHACSVNISLSRTGQGSIWRPRLYVISCTVPLQIEKFTR